jgi:hypothetical protein
MWVMILYKTPKHRQQKQKGANVIMPNKHLHSKEHNT